MKSHHLAQHLTLQPQLNLFTQSLFTFFPHQPPVIASFSCVVSRVQSNAKPLFRQCLHTCSVLAHLPGNTQLLAVCSGGLDCFSSRLPRLEFRGVGYKPRDPSWFQGVLVLSVPLIEEVIYPRPAGVLHFPTFFSSHSGTRHVRTQLLLFLPGYPAKV